MEKKRILILYENNHYIIHVRKTASFITFQVKGRRRIFFLMASYLHNKFQRN